MDLKQRLKNHVLFLVFFIFTMVTSALVVMFSVACWIRATFTALVFSNVKLLGFEDAYGGLEWSSNNTIVNIIALTKRRLSVEDMKVLTLNKVINANDCNGKPLFPKMTCLLTLRAGYLMWSEDSNFNIDDHVRAFDGQPPRDEEELKLLVNQLCNILLHHNKPCWKIISIPIEYRKTNAPMGCLLFRIHHSMADGISIFRLIIEQMAGNLGEYQHILKRMTNKFKSNIKPNFICRVLNVFQELCKAAKCSMKSFKQMHTIDRNLSGKYIYDWTSDVKMSTIAEIRNKTCSTVNDIIMSCLAGAFRRHLLRQGLSPPPYSIQCVIPISFHSPADPIEMTNNLCCVHLELITGDMDCLQRLETTKAVVDQMKRSFDMTSTRWTIEHVLNHMPLRLTQLFNHFFWARVFFSNVPGPTSKASINGNEIESLFLLAQTRSNKDFGVAVFSYSGSLTVSVTVDTGIVGNRKELHLLLDDFAEELRHLHQLATS